ncbi:MAG: hypothetical protein VXY93_10200, partial [Pseudomonadota bacterium]|nr:hypothetical protein [Pseudomonadota bacterium]
TGIGRDALRNNLNGTGNVAVGRAAMYNSQGDNNTALGQSSLYQVGVGKSNTTAGTLAGYNLVSGSNNIILGYNAQASATNANNEITLGNSLTDHLRVPGIGVSFNNTGGTQLGIITATELDISGDIDVDGHTNLDNVSIAGVVTATTFVGALTGTASGNTTIIGAGNNKIVTSYQNNELVAENGLTWTGSVFETSGGAETWTMRAKSGGPSSKIGFQNQYLTNGFTIGCGAANQSFVVYTGGNNERVRIDSTGITTFSQNLFASKDFDVDGHTNLDNVSIAGVSTVTTFLQVLGQAGTSDKGFEVRANSTQNTDTNKAIRIRNNSNTDTFNISYKGKVTATELDISGNIDVDGHTNLDNVSVAGVSTFSGVVRVPNGSAGAPAIHFGDSDSGVYGDSSNGVRLTAGGSDTIVATTNGVTFPPQATALTSLTLGSQSALSKPLYFADAASVQSSSILLDNSSQELRIKNGRFSGQITFTTYNTEKLRITSGGVVCIGTQPKSWNSAYKVLQVGAASLVGQVEGDGTTSNWSN